MPASSGSSMRCSACPADRHSACDLHGCHAQLALFRVGVVDGSGAIAALTGKLRHLIADECDAFPGSQPALPVHALHDNDQLAPQVSRLDIEDGDILTVRTRAKLTAEKAARYQRELLELCRSQGFRHVSVIILDDCSDLTIERPRKAPTGMQHQHVRPFPISSY